MKRYLNFTDWVLLGFNIMSLIYILRPNQSFTKPEHTIFSEFFKLTSFICVYGFAYIFPVIWVILWYIRRYYKLESTLIWRINRFFFFLSLLYFCIKILPNFLSDDYIY
jgi:hypothetical protein